MSRRHDIDALRVLAFALLILYHAAMVYVADWGYHFKSAYQHEWLQWPMIALNRWRMPLLFMISGIALALAKGAIAPGFGAFLWRYLQLRPWPDGGWSGAEYGVTWNHLWYLAYVWLYSMLLLLLAPVLEARRVRRCRDALFALDGPARTLVWVWLPAAWGFACLWWLMPRFPETHALWGDWFAHAKYGTFFLAGWVVAREDRFWAVLRAARWRLLWLALFAISIELSLRAAGRYLPPGEIPAWALQVNWSMIERMARGLYAWTALLAIFGWAAAWLDRPFRWLPYASRAVYPWYILHQSVIVLIAFLLAPLELGPWLEPTLVLAGTITGCAILYECIIRRLAILRPLFGVGPPHSPAPAHTQIASTESQHVRS